MNWSASTALRVVAIRQWYVCEGVSKEREKLQISSQYYIITERESQHKLFPAY